MLEQYQFMDSDSITKVEGSMATFKTFQTGPVVICVKWCNKPPCEQCAVCLIVQNAGLVYSPLLAGALPLTDFLIYCCKYAP